MIETSNVYFNDEYAKIHVDTQPGPHVMMAIMDTGRGIDKEIFPHIFEPFFTTKEISKGTGLGLSTVYSIVHQSDGTIQAESEAGHGATFKIFLPQVNINSETVNEKKMYSSKNYKGTETILVVEDDDAVRDVISQLLTAHGYKVLGESSGEEALILSEKYNGVIDLIITDVIMIGMHGKELVDILLQQLPKLKVLYISGYMDDTLANYSILNEGVNFLRKPFDADLLISEVRKILDN
ncbi:MAG: hypothetical protein A2161_18355 [Candidatus Schekmanbacteria bacterium RBG_13_48_7]|uniref:histidine kinase n=1 Tax=Candidatus Schekmanbacteria bacterium RBG_13_48_7 TaxID=1817878 RepID=A0A1F7S0W8_9BACT|nr:MAG: hypothetical protein A2161_18355 [Candidatus Schekmanbacteria bacterium RBG_13_48_7]